MFQASTAPTGLDRVKLLDLRALGEARSLIFLEELGQNVVQGRKLRWRRGDVAWERNEETIATEGVQSENLEIPATVSTVTEPDASPTKIIKAREDFITVEAVIDGKSGKQVEEDVKPSKDAESSQGQLIDVEKLVSDKYEEDFRHFVAGAQPLHVEGEEVYEVEGRAVVLIRDARGRPLRAVGAEGREELELEVAGWEWDPVKLLQVVKGESDGQRTYGKGAVLWDGEGGDSAELLRAVAEAEVVEPEEAEWEPAEEEEDSDDEGGVKARPTRQQTTTDEAMRLLQSGEVPELHEAMAIAERTVLLRSFQEVDADGSGRVDPEELIFALREMGLAATEVDVREMMAAVDEGGRLRALKAKVSTMRARAAAFELGLKESERSQLAQCEQELRQLQQDLDVDDDDSFGFDGYCRLVRINDESSHKLPRMAPFPQTLFVGRRQGKYYFRNIHSRPWREVYWEMPRTVEHLRAIALQGPRLMGLQVAIMQPNAGQKNANGVRRSCACCACRPSGC